MVDPSVLGVFAPPADGGSNPSPQGRCRPSFRFCRIHGYVGDGAGGALAIVEPVNLPSEDDTPWPLRARLSEGLVCVPLGQVFPNTAPRLSLPEIIAEATVLAACPDGAPAAVDPVSDFLSSLGSTPRLHSLPDLACAPTRVGAYEPHVHDYLRTLIRLHPPAGNALLAVIDRTRNLGVVGLPYRRWITDYARGRAS